MPLERYILSKFSRSQLQSICKKHNLSISGTKSSLACRLIALNNWSEISRKAPFESLEWYEKTFLIALLDGAKSKSEILKTEIFAKLAEKITDDVKRSLFNSVFRWSKKVLVRGRLVNYSKRDRSYSLNEGAFAEISALGCIDHAKIVSEFRQSRLGRIFLSTARRRLINFSERGKSIVKYSKKAPLQLDLKLENDEIRLLAFSDWRVQDIEEVFRFIKKIDMVDFILYAGDDLARFRDLEGVNYFTELAKLSRSKKLLAVLGNDDFYSNGKDILNSEGVHDLYDSSIICGNFAFVGLESSTRGPAIFRYEETDFENQLLSQQKWWKEKGWL